MHAASRTPTIRGVSFGDPFVPHQIKHGMYHGDDGKQTLESNNAFATMKIRKPKKKEKTLLLDSKSGSSLS
jgi:hypothetical protein